MMKKKDQKSFVLQAELSYVGATCPFMFQGEKVLSTICFSALLQV